MARTAARYIRCGWRLVVCRVTTLSSCCRRDARAYCCWRRWVSQRAQPILVWGSGSQEAIIVAISFNNGAYQFLGSAEGVSSSRPRFCGAPRAAVVKAGRHCGGAADCVVSRPRLDDGEPGAKLDGRDDRSRSTAKVILDWAVNDACGNTASPCIRSGTKARYHNPSCTGEGKAQQRRDPSTKRVDHPGWVAVTRLSWLTSAVIARGRSEAWTQHGAGRHHAGLEITPERHHQLAGQRHDGNAAQPSLHVADTVTEPAAEVAAGLVS